MRRRSGGKRKRKNREYEQYLPHKETEYEPKPKRRKSNFSREERNYSCFRVNPKLGEDALVVYAVVKTLNDSDDYCFRKVIPFFQPKSNDKKKGFHSKKGKKSSIVKSTNLFWSEVKKTLERLLDDNFCGEGLRDVGRIVTKGLSKTFRERFLEHLMPFSDKSDFNPEEYQIIVDLLDATTTRRNGRIERKWSLIRDYLGAIRPANTIKNKFNSHMKASYESFNGNGKMKFKYRAKLGVDEGRKKGSKVFYAHCKPNVANIKELKRSFNETTEQFPIVFVKDDHGEFLKRKKYENILANYLNQWKEFVLSKGVSTWIEKYCDFSKNFMNIKEYVQWYCKFDRIGCNNIYQVLNIEGDQRQIVDVFSNYKESSPRSNVGGFEKKMFEKQPRTTQRRRPKMKVLDVDESENLKKVKEEREEEFDDEDGSFEEDDDVNDEVKPININAYQTRPRKIMNCYYPHYCSSVNYSDNSYTIIKPPSTTSYHNSRVPVVKQEYVSFEEEDDFDGELDDDRFFQHLSSCHKIAEEAINREPDFDIKNVAVYDYQMEYDHGLSLPCPPPPPLFQKKEIVDMDLFVEDDFLSFKHEKSVEYLRDEQYLVDSCYY